MTTQLHQRTTCIDIKEAFLAKEWNTFHSCGKKLDYLHLKNFLKYECELNLKQPMTPPQCKIIVLTTLRTIDLSLKLEDR